jgi:hypothetical protein
MRIIDLFALQVFAKNLDRCNFRLLQHYLDFRRRGSASVRHHEGPHGRDALPDQNAPKGSRRDGSFGSGLQSDTGHEHRGDQAADGRDRGLKPNRSWLLTDSPGGRFYTAKTQKRHREPHPKTIKSAIALPSKCREASGLVWFYEVEKPGGT